MPQTVKERRVSLAAARGNILDRYGRLLVSNSLCNNLSINVTELFSQDDPNAVILELCNAVERFGDTYTDTLPITKAPPFEFTEMDTLQKSMLDAWLKANEMPLDSNAVEILAAMRTRYSIGSEYSAEDARRIVGVRYEINDRYNINTTPYVFAEDVSMPLLTYLMEQDIPGFELSSSYVREYKTQYAAHLLGYTGKLTAEEWATYADKDYSLDAYVGKDGVEYAFEDYLHGEDGTVEETRNASGTILSTVYTKEPVPGDHVYLTIDIVLQEQVERILDNGIRILTQERMTEKGEQEAKDLWTFEDGFWEITGGAAVVVNVKTGEPLAIASWPTYDVTTIIENYSELMEAENAPLFNRALMGAYAPGSVFKPCTAIAALSEGIVNTEEEIKCEGVYTRYASEGYAPECWIWSSVAGEHYTHGELNVTGALLNSCNYFFYSVGNFLGIDNLEKYARDFGLGEATGIELVETTGNMSSEDTHMDYAGTEWRIGDTLQAAIGQSDSIFSPLQLAEYCAAVANSGTRYSASILKSVRNYDYSEEVYTRQNEVMSTVTSAQYNWDAVHEGMYEVANNWQNEAVAKYFVDMVESQRTAAKTGTAQKGENIVNDAIFICYGPYKDPEVAVAIVVERGKAGANCAFMARQILDVYYNIKSYSDSSESEMSLLK